MSQRFKAIFASFVAALIGVCALANVAQAYTANKVWFEFRKNGRYRVYINYTVPAIKEFREMYVDFTNKKKAEAFYWDVVRGADFYPPNPEQREFTDKPPEAQPW